MKVMKGMKRMKVMKVVKKKAMKVVKKKSMKVMKKIRKKSTLGSKGQVFKGTRLKTKGGIKQSDLMKNKEGRVVTKRQSAMGHKAFKNIENWVIACKKARVELGLTGFVAIKKGSDFYNKAKE